MQEDKPAKQDKPNRVLCVVDDDPQEIDRFRKYLSLDFVIGPALLWLRHARIFASKATRRRLSTSSISISR